MILNFYSHNLSNTFFKRFKLLHRFPQLLQYSPMKIVKPPIPFNIFSIFLYQTVRKFVRQIGNFKNVSSHFGVLIVNNSLDFTYTGDCRYAWFKYIFVKCKTSTNVVKISSIIGKECFSKLKKLFTVTLKSSHRRISPFGLTPETIGVVHLLLVIGL